jgi:hypothetical protein
VRAPVPVPVPVPVLVLVPVLVPVPVLVLVPVPGAWKMALIRFERRLPLWRTRRRFRRKGG